MDHKQVEGWSERRFIMKKENIKINEKLVKKSVEDSTVVWTLDIYYERPCSWKENGIDEKILNGWDFKTKEEAIESCDTKVDDYIANSKYVQKLISNGKLTEDEIKVKIYQAELVSLCF